MSYLFSKKIKCTDCDGNYRGINERGKRKYYCSSYHNYRTCTRWILEESVIVSLIYNHFEIALMRNGVIVQTKSKQIEKPEIDLESILNRVEVILVSPKEETFTIQFKDGTKVEMSPNRQTYYKDEI